MTLRALLARPCTPAVRYIRVIALVATSDAEYLSQLCLRDVPMATMTCELGMRSPVTHRPTPAAFPACCLVVSGRGVHDNDHSTDVESPPPPPPRVCMSVYPEIKACSDLGRVLVLNDPAVRDGRCRVLLRRPRGGGARRIMHGA